MLPFAFRFCCSCARTKAREEQETPRAFEPLVDKDHDSKVLYALACFKGEQFKLGDGVYLHPDSFNFRWVKWFKWQVWFTQTCTMRKMYETHCLCSWLSVWSQLVQWSALIGKRMWMKTCIQNITGSLQTTSRGLTCMLQSPSALGASRRSSITDVAMENLTCQRSNCDSTSSTGKTHYNSVGCYWG